MLEKINPITDFNISLMNPSGAGSFLGWIRLLNGANDAGYIYLVDDSEPEPPRLSDDKSYIVMNMPTSRLANLLTILKSGMSLQIRFYDAQVEFVVPSAFLEPRDGNPPGLFGLKTEEAEWVSKRLGQPEKSSASKTRRK